MKLPSTIFIASTAAALKNPQRAAPMKALQLRGGGMVKRSTAVEVTRVVFSIYMGRLQRDNQWYKDLETEVVEKIIAEEFEEIANRRSSE